MLKNQWRKRILIFYGHLHCPLGINASMGINIFMLFGKSLLFCFDKDVCHHYFIFFFCISFCSPTYYLIFPTFPNFFNFTGGGAAIFWSISILFPGNSFDTLPRMWCSIWIKWQFESRAKFRLNINEYTINIYFVRKLFVNQGRSILIPTQLTFFRNLMNDFPGVIRSLVGSFGDEPFIYYCFNENSNRFDKAKLSADLKKN